MKIKLITIVSVILSLVCISSNAQSPDWVSQVSSANNDSVQSVTIDSSGNSISVGYFSSSITLGTFTLTSHGGLDIFVSKYDPSGSVLWATNFGSATDDQANGVIVDSTGNIFVVGQFTGTIDFGNGPLTSAGGTSAANVFAIELNSSGQTIWSKKTGGTANTVANAIAIGPDNNIVIVGSFQGTNNFGSGNVMSTFSGFGTLTTMNTFVWKLKGSDGSFIWAHTPSNDSQNRAYGVTIDSNTNVLFTGSFEGNVDFIGGFSTFITAAGAFDIFVVKYSGTNGSMLWEKRFGSTDSEEGLAITTDSTGDAIVCGYFRQTVDFGNGNLTSSGADDIFLMRLVGSTGTTAWSKRFGSFDGDRGQGLTVDSITRNIIMTGFFSDTVSFGGTPITSGGTSGGHFGSFDVFSATFNSAGTFIISQGYGGLGNEQGKSVFADNNQHSVLGGLFNSDGQYGSFTLHNSGGTDGLFLHFLDGKTYYMDSSKVGSSNNTGTNSSNAFTNWIPLGGLDGQWTSILKGGDTLLIYPGVGYVGNRTGVPDAIVMFNILGLTNNPILFKVIQTNGLVKTPPLVVSGNFFTFDGRLSDTYTNTINFDNMDNLYQITNNINWLLQGVYGFGSNSQNGIYMPNVGYQAKFTWLHVDPKTFNTNNWPFGGSDSGVGANTHGINLLQNTGEHLDGGEIAYCYIEEADQCCIAILNNNTPIWRGFRIHHNIMTKQGDAGARLAGGMEFDHNIVGNPAMIHGHPNGVVMAPNLSLFHHNVIFNSLDTMFYTPGGGSPIANGIKVYNNLFYTTWDWSFIYTNQYSSNLPFVNHSIGGLQFLVEANANNVEPWLPTIYTNFLVFNNTFMAGMGSVATNANAGMNGIISLPNRYAPGNTLSVDPGLDRGFIIVTQMVNLNNLFYNVSASGSGQTIGGWGGWVDKYSGNTNDWTNNINISTAGILFDWRNTNGGNFGSSNVVVDYNVIAADHSPSKLFVYNGPFSTNDSFASAELFNTTYATNNYTHNSSAHPSLVNTNAYDFHPRVSDNVLVNRGKDLSSWTNSPGGLPQYNMDLSGVTRSATPSIGAYEPQTDLIVHYTFDDLYPATGSVAMGVSPFVTDITGYGSTLEYFGFIATPTNWPTQVIYTNKKDGFNYSAKFVRSTNNVPSYGNFTISQFGVITNINALSNLSAITISVWAKYTTNAYVVSTFVDTCEGSPGNGVTWSLGRNSALQTSFDLFTNLDYNTSSTLHLNYPDNQSTVWHHYVATFSTTNKVMNIYMDGTNCGTKDFTGYSAALTNLIVGVPSPGGSYPGKNGWLALGCRTHVGSPSLEDGDLFPNNGWMDGELHDFRIYNRALSSGEVLSLFNGGGASGSIPGPTPPPPVFTQQPASTNIYVTQSTLFTVTVNGTAPLTYLWTTNGVAAGTNGPVLSVGPCPIAWDGMQIICIVTNLYGVATSSTATLGVLPDPVITTQPANSTVGVGSTASFNVVATGQSGLTYQWNKNGSSIAGATHSNYTTPATVAGDNNSHFTSLVTDNAGSVLSATATLTVTNIISPPDPVITAQPQSTNIYNTQAAIFSLTATGATTIAYQWKTNGVNVGTNGPTLAFNSCPIAWNGLAVLCVLSDVAGSVTSSIATLTISADPVINTQPHNSTVIVNNIATFSVTGTGQTALSYQWSQNGLNIAGATQSAYTTPTLNYVNNGDFYFVDVTDSAGTLRSSTATLTVLPPPISTNYMRATNLRIQNGGKIIITH